MTIAPASPAGEPHYLLTPNRSLDRRAALYLVAATAAAVFFVAGSLAVMFGAWPILPFAGLEVLLLAVTVWQVQARCDDEDRVVLGATHLDIIRRHRREVVSHRFNRGLVRVELRPSPVRNGRSRLEVGSHGKFVEIGAFLTDDERASLAEHLVSRLGGAAFAGTFGTLRENVRQ